MAPQAQQIHTATSWRRLIGVFLVGAVLLLPSGISAVAGAASATPPATGARLHALKPELRTGPAARDSFVARMAHGQRMQLGSQVKNISQSENWSGLAGLATGIEGAGGQWVVPNIALSTAPLYSSTWVGVDGASDTDPDLIQTGTSQDTADGYYAWIEILPAPEQPIIMPDGSLAPVMPGDQISAYVVATTSADVWTIDIEDATQNWYFNQNFSYYGPGQSAEWIEEAPTVDGQQSVPADFGTAYFYGTQVYGDFGSAGTAWYGTDMDASNEIEMTTQDGTKVLAVPSAPSSPTANGQSFTDTFVTPPLVPTGVVATPGVGSIALAWQAPVNNGGTPIVGYDVEVYLSGTLQQTGWVTATSVTVPGLSPGDSYSFAVAALNAGNWLSPYSTQTSPVTVLVTTTTKLSLAMGKVTYGDEQIESLAVNVAANYSGPAASGTVGISANGLPLCHFQLVSAPCQPLSATTLPAGFAQFTATFNFNPPFLNSTSSSEAVLVAKASTTTSLKLSAPNITYGHEQTEHISVVVTPQYAGSVPTGIVTVRKSTTTLCTIALSRGKGACTFTARRLKAGHYHVFAVYAADRNFKGSASISKQLAVGV